MAVCNRCNAPLEENATFCGYCGERTVPRQYDRALQEQCLHTLYNRLCTERKCWRIFGFVFLGFAIFFAALPIFLMTVAALAGGEEAFFFGAFAGVYLVYGLIIFLPLCIINFVVASKLNYYIDNFYYDCGPALKRCGEPGAIVLGALCNEISLIFIIINFVYIKRNAAVFAEIRRNQTGI